MLYFSAPLGYNLAFCSAVTILFVLQGMPFVIKKSEGNYINFYTLFFFSFFFINFFYPTILYPVDPGYFSVFTIPFNHDCINKGTALAQLSASSLIFGASSIRELKKPKIKLIKKVYFIDHTAATIITMFVFILFIVTVGKDFLAGDFTAHSSLSLYVLELLRCCFILVPIIFFQGIEFQKHKNLFYLATVGYMLLFLTIGDRGPALNLIILIAGLFTFYVKRVSIKYLIPIAIAGVLFFELIGYGRVNDPYEEGNAITRGIANMDFQNYYNFTSSFVVNARNLYVGMEYVENHGINKGNTLFLPLLLSIIPFGQSAFEKIAGIEIQTSAYLFTVLGLGQNPSYGLGTNLVADVYISFGLIGCILFFYLIGRIVEYYRRKMTFKGDIFSNIVYFTLLSFSISYPRSELFSPLRYIIWTTIIYHLLELFGLIKTRHFIQSGQNEFQR